MTERDDDWAPKFLATLAEGWPVETAARVAGINRSTAYRRKKADKEFAAAWDDAFQAGTDMLEEMAIRRAMEHSDNLLITMLKARRPEVYTERHRLEHTRVDYQDGHAQLERMAAKMLTAVKEEEDAGHAESDRPATPIKPGRA